MIITNPSGSSFKKSLPSKTSEALKAVTSAIIANKDKIVGAAFKVGAALVGALINGINSKIGELVGKIANLASKMTMAGTIPKFAEGVRNFGGGLALVGEQGPELVTLPRGSSVYTASQTRRMLPTEANNIYGSSYNQEHKIYNIDKIVIDAKNVKEFNDVVNLMKNMKVEYNTRRY
jgi:phage-related minor tail protein